MLVDLFTPEEELASLILEEYQENPLAEGKYLVDTSEPEVKVFCLYELDEEKTLKFLSNCRDEYEYEIRRSHGGKIIETNERIAFFHKN